MQSSLISASRGSASPSFDPAAVTSRRTSRSCVLGASLVVLGASAAASGDVQAFGWGESDFGQLDTPALLGSQVSAVSCGVAHTYALRSDGTIIGWGYNGYGQINTPSTATNVTQLACGEYHTYALKNDGTLVGWGYNDYGQINTPSTATNVTQVACGYGHTYALRNDVKKPTAMTRPREPSLLPNSDR